MKSSIVSLFFLAAMAALNLGVVSVQAQTETVIHNFPGNYGGITPGET